MGYIRYFTFFSVSCRFIQINRFNLMGLCSVPAVLYKIAIHGTNNSIFQFLRNRDSLKLVSEEVV